jgi:hypothetical protein
MPRFSPAQATSVAGQESVYITDTLHNYIVPILTTRTLYAISTAFQIQIQLFKSYQGPKNAAVMEYLQGS